MQLKKWIDSQKMSVMDFAKKYGLTFQSVFNWISGRNKPMRIYRAKIEQITDGKVKQEDWEHEQEINKREDSSKKDGLHNTRGVRPHSKASPKSRKKKPGPIYVRRVD